MNSAKSKQPSNIHSNYALDQIETEEDCRALIALYEPQEAARLGKITFLPTSYSDKKQRERRPDKVVKAEVLDENGKLIGERIYLFEFKSWISKTLLLLQLLAYLSILWETYRLPVRAIVVYTGKRRLRQSGHINFRDYMQSKNPVVDEHDLNFPSFLLNIFGISVAELQDKAFPIAPGLYLAPRVFDLDEEIVSTFFRLCAQLPEEKRERQLEKGCIFMIKYGSSWDELICVEKKTLPKEDWIVARVAFSREAYGEEKLHQGRAEGKAEGKAEGRAEGKGEERRDIAMRMLREGESEAKISRITGMTKKELALLKRGARKR